MSRTVLVFEDAGWSRLYPLTLARPSFECRIGVTTLGRRLTAQLSRRGEKRIAYLCRPRLRPILERELPGHPVNHAPDTETLFLNGRLLALGESLAALSDLVEHGSVAEAHGRLAAALLRGDEAAGFAVALESALDRNEAPPIPPDRIVIPLPEGARLVERPWDLIAWNRETLEDDFHALDHPQLHESPELEPGAQVLHRDRIRCREGVVVESGAILDAGPGPIFLSEGVRVLHHAVIVGPAAVGPRSLIKMGAKMDGGVSVGPVCKVGGEIEAAVFQGFANKQHDGYLGHSVVGAWVNLGAGTITSDLKNNYGTVRVWTPAGWEDTGQRFVGSFVGDHAKTAIGTTLNTGTVIGFSANVFGAGFPSQHVPSFSWGWGPGAQRYDVEKALVVARAVMERRQVLMEPADEVLFRAIAAETGP
jgi:UDP-N-acetylglucosamine diphosphorylase/glucosamine-1-phosphate N-acetyltransferase